MTAARITSLRRPLSLTVALLLAMIWLPALLSATPAHATPQQVQVTPVNESCNGILPTPGSENTEKKLVGGNLEPGGTATFEISYPTTAADVGQTFTVTDCPILGGDVAHAQAFQFSFVPNNVNFSVEFNLTIPAGTPIGTSYCNYAKTTAGPSKSPASNRKAGPACFTVGGNLRIEKHATGNPNQLLSGAQFSVSCPTAAPADPPTASPVEITGLKSGGLAVTAAYVTADGAWEASGTADPGFIGISGPSGTDCAVTETAAPPGFVLPDTTTQHYTIPVGTTQDAVDWFNDAATADVQLVKSANPASESTVEPGSPIDYTLSYYNDGNLDAPNETVTDTLPPHTTFVSASGNGKYDSETNTVTWTGIDVTDGTSSESPAGSVSFRVTVDGDTPNGTELDNTGHIQAPEGTPIDSNTTHHFVKFAVLSIDKSADPASGSIVQRGDQIDYTITVSNTGLAEAKAQTVTDTLPDNVTVKAGSIFPTPKSSDGSTITWLVDVPAATEAGAGTTVLTYSVTVDATAPLGSTQTNVATLGDHSSTTDHHVPTGALTLVKHVDKTSAAYGATLTYTFDAASTGQLDQTAVVVTDVLPPKTTYVAGSAKCTDGGTCTATFDKATNTVTWALGDMAAGAAARHMRYQVTIDTPAFDPTTGLSPETILNSGVVASHETPSTTSNQVKTVVTAVLGVKVVRPPRLPFTGSSLPISTSLVAGLSMLGVGIVLTSLRRRKG